MSKNPTSRIIGFSKSGIFERRKLLLEANEKFSDLNLEDLSASALSEELAQSFVENCVGSYALPLGVALNFVVDGKDVLVPMAVEESSVLAAASYGAKLARNCGGFFSIPTETIATAQIEFFAQERENVRERFESVRDQIVAEASGVHPRLIARGGGVCSAELREIDSGRFVIHLNVNTLEAMGANIVNTMAEKVGEILPSFISCDVGLRILTNLTTHRVTRVHCEISAKDLAKETLSGEEVVNRIVRAWEFANLDPFRASTHNKGVMNGIDPVVIATGNDWRAVEAGCHAFATLGGGYKPLTTWKRLETGNLRGEIAVPIAVGTVGGVTRLHPGAQACLRLMGDPTSARLSAVIASVGLAQNLSALRALACEGIQKGHMALHQKNLDLMRENHLRGLGSG